MRALVLFLLAAAPLSAAEQRFPADADGAISFQMPSGNIGCTYLPKDGPAAGERAPGPELVCERVEPAYAVLVLGPEGFTNLIGDPGEAGCCGGRVLRYGNHWQEGPFSCLSEREGLTCRREDGHGFSLARARIRLF